MAKLQTAIDSKGDASVLHARRPIDSKRGNAGVLARRPITNGTHKKDITPKRKRSIVAAKPEANGAFGAVEAATDWRFQLATLTRISDNLVSRAVHAYDRMFGLDDREEVEIYLEVGKKLAAEERFDDAIAALRKVLRRDPNHQGALFELGGLHLRQGAPLAAIAMLEQARDGGLSERKLHLMLADAFCREERFKDALAELDTALTMKPELAETHYKRALVLDRLDQHAQAVEALQKAIKLAPREIRYHHRLGFTLETLGRRTEAIQCFKRALDVERTRELRSARQHDDELDEHDDE
jgi:tetratricopeptide (TPR) repeat protein